MKHCPLILLYVAACLVVPAAVAQDLAPGDDGNAQRECNVNSRYTVERIDLAGEHEYALSGPVLQHIDRLIGGKLDFDALNGLAQQISSEVHASEVSVHVNRGSQPNFVRVTLDIRDSRSTYDLAVPKFLWHSSEGWTAEGVATGTFGDDSVSFGLTSNGDDLMERYQGFSARYQRRSLGTDRVKFAFLFEEYHVEWNQATLAAIASSPKAVFRYRARRNVQPEITFLATRTLSFSAGFSAERMEADTPGVGGESANALTGTAHYHRTIEGSSGLVQTVDVTYDVRAATRAMGSDFGYTRHFATARYAASRNRHMIEAKVVGGAISGTAPMFERFAAGNAEIMPGWNKFDLDPLGGGRLVDGSLEYRYRMARVFYDAGAIWDRGGRIEARQSVGAGIGSGFGLPGHNEFLLALAFPLYQGHMDPVLVAGMNF